MTFPERLKSLREERSLSQRQLAEIAGVNMASINLYEHGKTDPRAFNLCCLADALKVSTDYLLGRTDIR